MNDDEIIKIFKESFTDNTKIQLRTKSFDLWSKVYNSMNYKSILFSERFVGYQFTYNKYFDDKILDLSFIVFYQNEPVSLLPVFYFKKKNEIYYFDNNIFFPLFKKDLSEDIKKIIINKILQFFLKLKKSLKIKKINISLHSPDTENILSVELKETYKMSDNFHLYLDLRPSLSEIRRNFRKSYLNIINKKIENKILIFDGVEKNSKIWSDFKNLHFAEAKRKTRSDLSWQYQLDNIYKKKALLIYSVHKDEMIAGSFFDISSDEAYYSVGAYNELAKKNFLSHHIQNQAIKEFKTKNIKWYFLGKYSPDNISEDKKKEYSISFFKKGFSSNIVNNSLIQI